MFSCGVIPFLVSLCLVSAQTQKQPTCIDDAYKDLSSALTGLAICSYPAHKLTPECVLESCPELKSQCPTNNDDGANTEDIQKTIQIVNDVCIKKDSICGAKINPISIPKFSFQSASISFNILTGQCIVPADTSIIINLNHTSVSLASSDSSKLKLTIEFLNVSGVGYVNCDTKLGIFEVPLNNTKFNIPVSFNSEAELNLDNPKSIPTSGSSNLRVDADIGPLKGLTKLLNSDVFNDIIQRVVSSTVKKSQLMFHAGNFVAALTKQAILATQQC